MEKTEKEMISGIHTVWGMEPTWDKPIELDTGITAKDINAIRTEWRREYPLIKFHIALNNTSGEVPISNRWF